MSIMEKFGCQYVLQLFCKAPALVLFDICYQNCTIHDMYHIVQFDTPSNGSIFGGESTGSRNCNGIEESQGKLLNQAYRVIHMQLIQPENGCGALLSFFFFLLVRARVDEKGFYRHLRV